MTLEKLMEELAQKPGNDPGADLRALRDAFVKRAGRINDRELAKFADLTIALLSQVPLIERMAFARQIAKHRNTPKQLVSLLTVDHYLVSAPVLESAPHLTEDELVDVIDRFGEPVFLAIAKRGELSVQLTDRLMDGAGTKVQQELARNTGARLSRKSMVTLCDLAEDDVALRDSLSRRRDLPQALTARLKALGAPQPTAATPAPVRKTTSGPGVGRAGIVLSADLMNAKPKPKPVKTFRYS